MQRIFQKISITRAKSLGKTDLWPRYREGVINGTDPGQAEYWGPVPSGDQIMVEMTLLSLGLAMVL
jgi:hypothetical protein